MTAWKRTSGKTSPAYIPKADIGPDYGEVLEIVEERVEKTVGAQL